MDTEECIAVRLGTFNFGMTQQMFSDTDAWESMRGPKFSDTVTTVIDGAT